MIGWKVLTWEEGVNPEADDYGNPEFIHDRPFFVRYIMIKGAPMFQLIGPESGLAEIELRVFHDLEFPTGLYAYADFDPKTIS